MGQLVRYPTNNNHLGRFEEANGTGPTKRALVAVCLFCWCDYLLSNKYILKKTIVWIQQAIRYTCIANIFSQE